MLGFSVRKTVSENRPPKNSRPPFAGQVSLFIFFVRNIFVRFYFFASLVHLQP